MNGPIAADPLASAGAAAGLPLLEVAGLTVLLQVSGARRAVLRDVSLALRPGEAVGLVGESGSGKSMTARALGRLLPPGAETRGSIRFGGTDIGGLAGADLRRYRSQVAMIFQDPRAHVNPVRRQLGTHAQAELIAVSAGVEPGVVPTGVLHVGGGRPAFLRLLDEQVRRRGRVAGVDAPHAPSPHPGLTPVRPNHQHVRPRGRPAPASRRDALPRRMSGCPRRVPRCLPRSAHRRGSCAHRPRSLSLGP